MLGTLRFGRFGVLKVVDPSRLRAGPKRGERNSEPAAGEFALRRRRQRRAPRAPLAKPEGLSSERMGRETRLGADCRDHRRCCGSGGSCRASTFLRGAASCYADCETASEGWRGSLACRRFGLGNGAEGRRPLSYGRRGSNPARRMQCVCHEAQTPTRGIDERR